MYIRTTFVINSFVLLITCLFLSSCAKKEASFCDTSNRAATSGSGVFDGVWNVKLTALNDGCGFGVKSIPATIVVEQRGAAAVVTIVGLKTYKGVIASNQLSVSGKYSIRSGSKISRMKAIASLRAVSQSEIRVRQASLVMKRDGNTCVSTFKGRGDRMVKA